MNPFSTDLLGSLRGIYANLWGVGGVGGMGLQAYITYKTKQVLFQVLSASWEKLDRVHVTGELEAFCSCPIGQAKFTHTSGNKAFLKIQS